MSEPICGATWELACLTRNRRAVAHYRIRAVRHPLPHAAGLLALARRPSAGVASTGRREPVGPLFSAIMRSVIQVTVTIPVNKNMLKKTVLTLSLK